MEPWIGNNEGQEKRVWSRSFGKPSRNIVCRHRGVAVAQNGSIRATAVAGKRKLHGLATKRQLFFNILAYDEGARRIKRRERIILKPTTESGRNGKWINPLEKRSSARHAPSNKLFKTQTRPRTIWTGPGMICATLMIWQGARMTPDGFNRCTTRPTRSPKRKTRPTNRIKTARRRITRLIKRFAPASKFIEWRDRSCHHRYCQMED